ncbi:AraC-like DNA-binding protein/beta-xylosidase [Catenibacillus scindens]|uniref:AraC-like DNA-binding protein/beta-xylosidase n=1 Tax=Catenibacillus scindens TaxID=673271 RepID=A0A7W8M5W5_9FIRM|nr:helix-turn-helix domain-containing protein [Catenibacillus scindens]MBB5265658.1 AraC-like DNA-binding protein/beta-xylosidase [Catenibacillus scindens]
MGSREKEWFNVDFVLEDALEEHIHQEIEFIYIVDGKIRLFVGDAQFILQREDCVIVNSYHRHRWIALEKACVCTVHMDSKSLMAYINRPFLFFYCNSAVEQDSKYVQLRRIMSDLLSEYAVNPGQKTLMKDSLVLRLAAYLTTFFLSVQISGKDVDDDQRLENLLQYIHMNYFKKLSIKEMSDILCIAPTSFSRYFKKHTGMTFGEYLQNIRLHFAFSDLMYTDYPVTRIAEEHGFTNVSAFCRMFKKIYGYSPLNFRREYRNSELPGTSGKNQEISRVLKKFYKGRPDLTGQLDEKARKNIFLDVKTCSPFCNPWKKVIYIGNAYALLSSKMKDQILEAKKMLGFTYAKIDRIFFDTMRIRHGHIPLITNFEWLDDIFDFLVQNDIIPVVGIDNKPEMMVQDTEHADREYNNVILFESMEECLGVLSSFLKHIIERYGQQRAECWIFDCFYDEYHRNTLGMGGSFASNFTKISRCIKEHLPGAAVGGCGLLPAVNASAFDSLLSEWTKEPIWPDFISVDLYPYFREGTPEKIRLKPQILEHFFKSEISRLKDSLRQAGWGELPVKILGWNLGLSQNNLFNDSCEKGAMMLAYMLALSDDSDVIAYNCLSDLTIGFTDVHGIFSGKWGLINSNGIFKPAFWAMYMFARLEPFCIDRGEHYIVTTDKKTKFVIVCFNEKSFYSRYYMKKESEIDKTALTQMFLNREGIELHFSLTGIEEGTYIFHEYSVSPENGSALEEMERGGFKSEDTLSPEEEMYLKESCVPSMYKKCMKSDQSKLTFTEYLIAHEIRMILIEKVNG